MSDYWKQRTIELEDLLQSEVSITISDVNKIYAEANKVIAKKIEKIFSRYKNGGQIDSSYALQLLTAKQTVEERREMLEILSNITDTKARRRIINILDAPAYANRISRLQALSDYITAQAVSLGDTEKVYAKTQLEDIAKNAYYRSIYNDQLNEGKVYDFKRLADNNLKSMLLYKWNGKNYSDRIWKNNQRFIKKLQLTIELGCMTGMSLKELEEHILEDCIGADSESGQRFCAGRLIRTEVNYFANQGMILGYKEAGIKSYHFLATLDIKTSAICRSLDLKSFPVDEAQVGVNCPPMHPFCRSVTVPNTLSRTGTRWARDPISGKSIKVPKDMTYEQWYDEYVKTNTNALIKEKSFKNYNYDKKQYAKYKSVLRELSPKSLEEFINIKYNNIDDWKQLKRHYRTVNRYDIDGNVPIQTVLDLDNAAYYTKKTGFDFSSLTGKTKKSIRNNLTNGGNAATMLLDNEIYFSHSKFGLFDTFEVNLYTGKYPVVCLSKKPIFNVKDLGDGIQRHYDTEAKFLEHVSSVKKPDEAFTVTILSEKHICPSCKGVVKQFKEKYPKANVNIVSGKENYNGSAEGKKTWKYRRRFKNQ